MRGHFPRRSREHLILPRLLQWLVLSIAAALMTAAPVFSPTWAEHGPTSVPLVPRHGLSHRVKPFGTLRQDRFSAHSILLKDLSSGRTLYEFKSDRRLSPASLTKVASALVILENGQLHAPVPVSRKAAAAPRIRLRLQAGHVFSLEDLVRAMLITSANDACLAAVEHVAGSEERFVVLMNAKAHELGLLDTHFDNACGFDAPDHYSTAADLAKLTEIALQHPVFRALVRQELAVISPINANRVYLLRNTNRLLGRVPGVEGVKTGFTARAGRCLIAKVSQDGKELLLVLLHDHRRWHTAARLIQHGFQLLENTTATIR